MRLVEYPWLEMPGLTLLDSLQNCALILCRYASLTEYFQINDQSKAYISWTQSIKLHIVHKVTQQYDCWQYKTDYFSFNDNETDVNFVFISNPNLVRLLANYDSSNKIQFSGYLVDFSVKGIALISTINSGLIGFKRLWNGITNK